MQVEWKRKSANDNFGAREQLITLCATALARSTDVTRDRSRGPGISKLAIEPAAGLDQAYADIDLTDRTRIGLT